MNFVTAGYNVSPENKNNGFNYGFTLAFPDEESLNNYINHTEHKKVVENYLVPLINGETKFLQIKINVGDVFYVQQPSSSYVFDRNNIQLFQQLLK